MTLPGEGLRRRAQLSPLGHRARGRFTSNGVSCAVDPAAPEPSWAVHRPLPGISVRAITPRCHPPAHELAPSPSSTASAPGSTATPICTRPSPTASSCRDRTAPTRHRPSCPPDRSPRATSPRSPNGSAAAGSLSSSGRGFSMRTRPHQSHPLHAPAAQGGQLGRARPLTKVHAAGGQRSRRVLAV